MTDKLDTMIDEALTAEERALLNAIGEEPGYFTQVWGIFGGKISWVTGIMMLAQGVMFIASVWMAVKFFNATETLEALRWGLPSATLLLAATVTKLSLWPTLQANRVIREVKRLELQLARAQNR